MSEAGATLEPARAPTRNPWRDARPIRLLPLAVLIVTAFVGPLVSRYGPLDIGADFLSPPSLDHWLGTDDTGSDVFARLVSATGLDLFIGFTSVAVAFVAGVILGALVGYSRSWWPSVVMWIMDFLQSFPVFILALALVAARGQSISTIIIVVAFLNLPIFVRLVRSEVLGLRSRAFVDAARAAGAGHLRIVLLHVLPNSLTAATSQASVNIGWALLLTSGLTFVGAGVQAPTPEWGGMIATGANYMITGQWWMSFFPGVALGFAVLAFALAGDYLKSAFGNGA